MLVAKFRQYLVKKASFSQNTSVYPFICNYNSTNAPCSFFCHSGDVHWTTYAAVPQRQNLISPQEYMTAKPRFCCSDTSLPETRSSAALTLRVTFSEKQLLRQLPAARELILAIMATCRLAFQPWSQLSLCLIMYHCMTTYDEAEV